MFEFFNKRKSSEKNKGEKNHEEKLVVFSTKLEENMQKIKEIFCDDDTLVERQFTNNLNDEIKCCIFYTDGMIDNDIINDSIIFPLQTTSIHISSENLMDVLMKQVLRSNEVQKTNDLEKIIQAIIAGDTVLFAQGSSEALILNTKGYALRAVVEPESEKVIRGPREGFTEGILRNLTMLRRRIRTPNLKTKYMTFGTVTKTKACICYIEGIVNKQVLNDLYKRLNTFQIDGVLDVNYIAEIIRDSPKSLFKTIGFTERPDMIAAKLLEGRVALFLDGTPVVITVPYLFIENFQSNEDYYVTFIYSSITRLLRICSFFATITVPALYVSIVTYHQEMLPTPMLLSIATARQDVPFPTIIELFGIIIVFQILTETGIRMATGIGQALSILGALVIGQSAVEARIVSAPVIIVVALVGITGLVVPRLSGATLVIRPLLLMLAAFLGFFGFTIGMIALLIHLYNLNSFGVPFFTDILTLDDQKTKDLAIRAPWWKMLTRPEYLTGNRTRMKMDGELKQ